MKIKIGRDIFKCDDINFQSSLIEYNCNLYLKLNINENILYKNYFLNFYDTKEKFDIISSNFSANNSTVISIDLDLKKGIMWVIVKSTLFKMTPIDKRRNNLIDELLTTFKHITL